MKRTRNRPLLPQSNGRPAALSKEEGLAWAAFTGGSGASILMACTDPLTTLLGVGNIALYAGVYTYMKPKTEWNTWVGAIVGAVPPVMGYTAATGGCVLEAEPILLGSTLFLWQFPHFMALNWMYREDCEYQSRIAALYDCIWYLHLLIFCRNIFSSQQTNEEDST
jgi:protoheme IX farnesyltransferase